MFNLSIKNFKCIEELELSGDIISISGSNWVWKSSILNAVERVLFWTVNGKSRTTVIQQWKEYAEVKMQIWKNKIIRTTDEKYPAYFDHYVSHILNCRILSLDPQDIKWILWEVFWSKYLKEKLPSFYKKNVTETIKHIKKLHKEAKKKYEAVRNKIEVYNEELDWLTIDEKQIEMRKEQIFKTKMEMEKYDLTRLNSLLKTTITNINDIKRHIDDETNKLLDLRIKIKQLNNKLQEIKTAKVCPVCWNNIEGQTINTEPVLKEIEQTIERGKKSKQLKESLEKSLEEKLKEKEQIELKIKEAPKDIEARLKYEELQLSKLNTKKHRIEYLSKEILKQVKLLEELTDEELYNAYEMIDTKWKFNIYLHEKIASMFKGYNVQLFKKSEYDWKDVSTFAITSENGIGHKFFSLSERMMLEIKLSLEILKELGLKDIPILIDNTESLSKKKMIELNKLLQIYKQNAIICKVNNKKLTIIDW